MRTDHRFAHARAHAGHAPECLHTLSGTMLRSRYPGARGLAGKGSYCSRVLPYGARVCPGACGVKSARVFPYGGTAKKTQNTNRSNTDHLRNASSARRFACGSPGGRRGNSQDHLRGSAASRDPFRGTNPLFLLCENVQNDTLDWTPGRRSGAWEDLGSSLYHGVARPNRQGGVERPTFFRRDRHICLIRLGGATKEAMTANHATGPGSFDNGGGTFP